MGKAQINIGLSKQMAPQRLNRPRALSPVRGSEVPVLVSVLLLLISASIYFLYLKREVYSSESASVYVHQRTWNFLTLAQLTFSDATL